MPEISVIMGIYNTKSKEYLRKSINSILSQTYTDFELIICNDGSTNDCFKWAKEICKNDDRVLFIENDCNRGLAYTLNHCLKNARGKYIARMDDDDESCSTRFEEQLEYLKKNDLDLVSCNIALFDSSGIYDYKYYPEIIQKKDFLFNSPIVHPAIIVKKEAFGIVGGYSEQKRAVRVEDYDLFMRMYANNVKMGVVQKVLFNYRDDKDTKMRRKKYKYRINEAYVRYKGFKSLKLFPKGIVYCIKPLIVGVLDVEILEKIKKMYSK